MKKIKVVVDTREQMPYDLSEHFEIVRRKLDAGDYSIEGYENRFAVERKTINDLVSTLVHSNERFKRELSILQTYEVKCIVAECGIQDILEKRYVGNTKPQAVLGLCASLLFEHNIPVLFCNTRQLSREFVIRLIHTFSNREKRNVRESEKRAAEGGVERERLVSEGLGTEQETGGKRKGSRKEGPRIEDIF